MADYPLYTAVPVENPRFFTAVTSGGGAVTTYVNRVYDTVASGFVRWSSTSAPDSSGSAYPGPGAFGVSTSGYCVESVI
jgi:hypothetical protein